MQNSGNNALRAQTVALSAEINMLRDKVRELQYEVKTLQDKVVSLEINIKEAQENMPTKVEFELVTRVVYGAVALILTTFGGAIIALAIKRG